MRFVLPNHVLPAGTAILEPTTQNWLADDASRAGPLREPAVPPRRRPGEEADLEGAVMGAAPTLTAGTVTVARTPEQANRAQRVGAEHPFLRPYDHHADPSASAPYLN